MKRERMRTSFKKMLSITLSTTIMVGGVAFLPQAKTEVYAATTVKDVNLGFGGISDPLEPIDDTWTGSKVYYGKNGEEAILWRVLDDSGFLFSEDVIGDKQCYHSEHIKITWSKSDLRNYLNKEDDASTFLNTYFTDIEQREIKQTTVTTEGYSVDVVDTSEDKIFLLSLEEVQNATYGFTNNINSSKTREASSVWWLRSPGSNDYNAALVLDVGNVISDGVNVNGKYGFFRPAFNLNLDSVIFISASGAGKSSTFSVVGSSNVSDTWKLTLEDGDENFNAELPEEGIAGSSITVNVETAGTDTCAQISAILSDSTDTVVAYGKIGENGTGDKTFTIPSSIAAGDYTLHVFGEQVNDGNETDYASKVVTGKITISAALTPPPAPTPIWTPSEDDLYRSSLVGWMPVEFTTSQVPYKFELINELQGPLCFEVFHAFREEYAIGATYSSLVDDMRIQQLSQGITVTLQIPSSLQKENRSYEMICVHKDGNAVVLTDLDTNPNTITFTTDKGYAFALCYKD